MQKTSELLKETDMSAMSAGHDALYYYIKKVKAECNLRESCIRHMIDKGCNPHAIVEGDSLLTMSVRVRDRTAFKILYPLVEHDPEALYIAGIKAGNNMVPEPEVITTKILDAAFKNCSMNLLSHLVSRATSIERNYILDATKKHFLANKELIRACVDKGFEVDESAILSAVRNNNFETVCYFLEYPVKISPECISLIEANDCPPTLKGKINILIEKKKLENMVQSGTPRNSYKI